MAKSATATVSRSISKPKTNEFPVFKMKVGDELLKFKRTNYGWEDLKRKGDAKKFPRATAAAAKASAFSYAGNHDFKIRTLPVSNDETGEVAREAVYYKGEGDEMTEVPFDSIPENIRDDKTKLEKAGFTMKMEPKEYIIVRITDPVKEDA